MAVDTAYAPAPDPAGVPTSRHVVVTQKSLPQFTGGLAIAGIEMVPLHTTIKDLPVYLARRGPAPIRPAAWDNLTNREIAMIRLIAEGATNAKIGTALGISESSVGSEAGRLYPRCGAVNRAHLVALAFEYGVLTIGGFSADDGPLP